MAVNHEDHNQIDKSKLLSRAIIIGLVGGFLWSAALAVSYFFNFTEIAPKSYLLNPWIDAGWVDRLYGHLFSIGLAGVLSLIPTFVYYGLFQRINSMWVGVGYGLLLWAVIFIILQPIIPVTRPMLELSFNTWVTTLTIFALYGLFVGYSISYDYHEKEVRLKKKRESS